MMSTSVTYFEELTSPKNIGNCCEYYVKGQRCKTMNFSGNDMQFPVLGFLSLNVGLHVRA